MNSEANPPINEFESTTKIYSSLLSSQPKSVRCWGRAIREVIRKGADFGLVINSQNNEPQCVEKPELSRQIEAIQVLSNIISEESKRDPHLSLNLLEAIQVTKLSTKVTSQLNIPAKRKEYIKKVAYDLQFIFMKTFSELKEEEVEKFMNSGDKNFKTTCPGVAKFYSLITQITTDLINDFYRTESEDVTSCERSFDEMAFMLERMIKIQRICFKNFNHIGAFIFESCFNRFYIRNINHVWGRINENLRFQKVEMEQYFNLKMEKLKQMREEAKAKPETLLLIDCFKNPFNSFNVGIEDSSSKLEELQDKLKVIIKREMAKEIELLKLNFVLMDTRIGDYEDGRFIKGEEVFKEDKDKYYSEREEYLRKVDEEFQTVSRVKAQVDILFNNLSEIIKKISNPKSDSNDVQQEIEGIEQNQKTTQDNIKNYISNYSITFYLKELIKDLVIVEWYKILPELIENNIKKEKRALQDKIAEQIVKREEERVEKIKKVSEIIENKIASLINLSKTNKDLALTVILETNLKEIKRIKEVEIGTIKETLRLGLLSPEDQMRLEEIEKTSVEKVVKQKLCQQVKMKLKNIVENILSKVLIGKDKNSLQLELDQINLELIQWIESQEVEEVIGKQEEEMSTYLPTDFQFNLKHILKKIALIEKIEQQEAEEFIPFKQDEEQKRRASEKNTLEHLEQMIDQENDPIKVLEEINRLLEPSSPKAILDSPSHRKASNSSKNISLIQLLQKNLTDQKTLKEQIQGNKDARMELKKQLLKIVEFSKEKLKSWEQQPSEYAKSVIVNPLLENNPEAWEEMMFAKSERIGSII